MPAFVDITGQRFGRLVVMRFSHMEKSGSRWVCRCDCKTEIIVRGNSLKTGATKSCGCFWLDVMNTGVRRQHGYAPRGTRPSAYTCWCGMKARCFNQERPDWERYGGRGITVCERWMTFENFLADLGEPPPGLSLDRIDNSGNYSPDNCRWATAKEQRANRRPAKAMPHGKDGRFISR